MATWDKVVAYVFRSAVDCGVEIEIAGAGRTFAAGCYSEGEEDAIGR